MRSRILFSLVIAVVFSACSNEPACSVEGGNMAAPSAGCLVVAPQLLQPTRRYANLDGLREAAKHGHL